MTAPVISPVAADAALCESCSPSWHVALDVLDHHDGVVNHQSRRQRDSKQRQSIDRESPASFTNTNVPISETGVAMK